MELSTFALENIINFIGESRAVKKSSKLTNLLNTLGVNIGFSMTSLDYCALVNQQEKEAQQSGNDYFISEIKLIDYKSDNTSKPNPLLKDKKANLCEKHSNLFSYPLNENIVVFDKTSMLTACYKGRINKDKVMCLDLDLHTTQLNDNVTYTLKQIVPHLDEAFSRLRKQDIKNVRKINLTSRENEVFKWAIQGKTYWEISKILSITERTIKFHMKNICLKLEVDNRAQAVAKAVTHGLI